MRFVKVDDAWKGVSGIDKRPAARRDVQTQQQSETKPKSGLHESVSWGDGRQVVHAHVRETEPGKK
jgi:hypothetical protein